ncbi:endonuclease/exonuclease/phosphatase family protein [uncultured Bifidobacterium sp.]|uniref:endonuclease/exonuclease/phosphatase family protein n=1 Tax=uncultured Bifidobacterium sp. TaxID=165187 RepID=UPI002583C24B|nr:endonuclease/exonuclease/phosphatase family protein [uncultured Bifidobacterium sp.]
MGLKHRWGYDLDNGSEEIKRFLEEFAEPDQEQVTDGRACTPAQARTRVHRYLDGLSWVVTFGVIAVMVLRMMPNGLDGKRYIPLIVAFVPWMAVLSAAILLISLISRRRVLAVISALCLLTQLVWHAGFLYPRVSLSSAARMAVTSATASVDDRYARLMTLNTRNGQADAAQIVQTVREQHVEVLALQELNSSMISRLNEAGIRELLPYSVVASTSSSDNGGVNGLWSAAPMSERTGDLIPIEASSIPAASIDFDGTVIRFGSVHPFSPRPSNQGLWDRGLGSISQLREDDHTFVLMGDFNATWDHASFRYLLGGRFVDAGENAGEWFHMTYPSNKKLFGVIPIPAAVEIDHIVHDRGVVVGDLDAVTIAGSDHKALLGTLEVR